MGRFRTTNWSLVLAARDEPSAAGRQALEALCAIYWYPLYACVRASGQDAETSQDLTQEFFALLLEKDLLAGVHPEGGRFRSYLLACLKHFLSHQRDRARALKRGGGTRFISLDSAAAEERFASEPADRLTPDEVFERRWALTVLDRSVEALCAEFVARGERDRFERLREFLTGQEPQASYREVASDLAMTEEAVRAAIVRLRRQLGRVLREQIADTVATPDQLDDEVRHLLRTVARPVRALS
jgi:RNA polymerase sigma-70 factor (ECF subfamily)